MFREITVQRLSAGTLFKLTGLGLALTFVPIGMLEGCFAFFGKSTVIWNQHPLTGISGLLGSPIIGLFFTAIFTMVLGSSMVFGLWFFSKFKSITLLAKVSDADEDSYSKIESLRTTTIHIPQWLRYFLLSLLTAFLTATIMYLGSNQFLALIFADGIAHQARGLAGSQKLVQEGKIDRANSLLCSLVAIDMKQIVELKRQGESGIFPKFVMESAERNDLQSIELTQEKLSETEVRCKSSIDITH